MLRIIGLRLSALPLAILVALLLSSPAAAQTLSSTGNASDTPGLQIETHDGALHIEWDGATAQAAAAATDATALPLVPYGDTMLPVTTLLVEIPAGDAAGAVVTADIAQLTDVPYTGELTPAPVEAPPALDWDPNAESLPRPHVGLPTAPVTILGEGMQRGRHLAVVAFSPIYQDPTTGELRYAETVSASVAGAQPAASSDALAAPDDASLFAPVATLADALGPTNDWADNNAVKLIVEQAGLQVIDGGALAAAGMSSPDAAKLQLFLDGVQVPLQIVDKNGANKNSGTFSPSDAVRFYAPTAGDAVNKTTVYWLVVAGSNGDRMTSRAAAPAGAPQLTTAFEPGVYYVPTVYDSMIPGADGDNWFVAVADVATDNNAGVSFDVTLPHRLPLASGTTGALTLHMTAYEVHDPRILCGSSRTHQVRAKLGSYNDTDQWNVHFDDDCLVDLTHPFTPTFGTVGDKLTVTLLKGAEERSVKFDAIDYALPVSLDFQGGGAIFMGVDGTNRYKLTNPAGGSVVYDITDPAHPVVLTGLSSNTFQDTGARRYLVSGSGVVFTPKTEAHTPVTFKSTDAAHIVYIAPAAFINALQPLVTLRQSQGYTVKVVDVQDIFDAWSYGMSDPQAIRDFLRFAVGHWNPAPLAAVLVGDGTSDPRDYLGYAGGNFIPPYLAPVDPWIGTVPCENCFAQLDGDDPLDEAKFLTEIWVGRLPANSVTDVQVMVDKIVSYESDTQELAAWRGNTVQVADDYLQADGKLDPAGNFPGLAETVIAMNPPGIHVWRNYYGATTDFSSLPDSLQTFFRGISAWFAGDPTTANKRTADYANLGVSLFTFTGHANHYKYAEVCPLGDSKGDPNCGNMLGIWDINNLHNYNHLFVGLSMTCYTAQFSKPAAVPVTMDENMMVHVGGGAVAVWGPAGLSVAHGHDTLQKGFYDKLWSQPPQKAKMGALTQAGYLAVASSPSASTCCGDVNYTFLLLGDPFTPLRIQAIDTLQLPSVFTPEK